MLSFPVNFPEQLKDELAEVSNQTSLQAVTSKAALAVARVCGAGRAVACCRADSDDRAPIEGAAAVDVSADTELSDFLAEWIKHGIDERIRADLAKKQAPLSLSAFSWPYASFKTDRGGSVPSSYSLLVPLGSDFLLQPADEARFSGYLVLLFESFPQLEEEQLNLIINLPAWLSTVVSIFVRQQRAALSIGFFAHDIKHYLLLETELLRGLAERDEETKTKSIKRLQRVVRRMLLDTNSRLLSVRDSQGRLKVSPLPTSMNDLVEECCSELELLFEASLIKLERSYAADLPAVEIDPAIFSSVINNILDNALKFSGPGTVVSVRTSRIGAGVEIAVEDQGTGIDESERKRVFERYYRGSNTAGTAGSGLGLYLVRRIVDAHGGTVALEPGRQGGTRVKIWVAAGEQAA